MKKAFCLVLLLALTSTSCGKKGNLKEPDDRVRFDRIVDEAE